MCDPIQRGNTMARFLAKRVVYELVTLFLVITATFFLIAGAPGDPIAAKVEQMPERAQQVIRAKYGLDRPVLERYVRYMKNLILKGDFGQSIVYTGRRVNDVIRENAPISGRVGAIALALDLVIGIVLGLLMAFNHGRLADHVLRVCIVLAICTPLFVFAAILQYYVAFRWRLAPIFGWGRPEHYIMPVLTMSIGGIAVYAKYMRSSALSVVGEDYIVTAKSKGCNRRRILQKHVLRNSMIPIVTMTGPSIAGIFGGSFIIEKVFSIPGLGRYYVKAVSDSDYTMVLGLTVFFAVLYVASLIAVDVMYCVVDPRIRIPGTEG